MAGAPLLASSRLQDPVVREASRRRDLAGANPQVMVG